MATGEPSGTPLGAEIRLLLQAGLAIFVFTVAVGILNGLDLIEFNREMLLAHVHAGALGWITLGFLGASLWIFSEGRLLTGWSARAPRWLSYGAVASVVLYAVAFMLGNLNARLAGGILTLLVVAGFFAWVVAQGRRIILSVAHLGMLAAMTTLTIGSILGVILGIWFKGGLKFLPEGIFTTHPTTMVVGYLILAGMAISEWRLVPSNRPFTADRLGTMQVILLFLAGLVLTVGALLNNIAIISANVPLEIAAMIIYVIRLGRRVARARWLDGGPERLYGASAAFLVANVALLTYLIVAVVTGAYGTPPDFSRIPPWLIFAMDHAMFIGVMTNALFALTAEATWTQRARWPWADHLIFWGMNVGLVGFVVGLMQNSGALKQIFTPIMGTGILIGVITYTLRLQTGRPAAATPEARSA